MEKLEVQKKQIKKTLKYCNYYWDNCARVLHTCMVTHSIAINVNVDSDNNNINNSNVFIIPIVGVP